jgi:hypothetical protein
MVMIPEMVRQVIRRTNIVGKGTISRRNGVLYGTGPGAGQEGPFPEEFNLTWQA